MFDTCQLFTFIAKRDKIGHGNKGSSDTTDGVKKKSSDTSISTEDMTF